MMSHDKKFGSRLSYFFFKSNFSKLGGISTIYFEIWSAILDMVLGLYGVYTKPKIIPYSWKLSYLWSPSINHPFIDLRHLLSRLSN